MGILKELTQALKNDPWIPISKKGPKPSAKVAVPPKLEKKAKGFCDSDSTQPCITVCVPREGCSCGCDAVREALDAEIRQQGLHVTIGNAKMGCAGTCANGPFVGFPQKGFFYLRVQPEDIVAIVHETLAKGRILFPLLSIDPDHSYRSDVYFERGTGFLGVIDEKISMVEIAKYFLDFEEGLSCGKCTPCRVGIKRLNESMERIASGEGTTDDLRIVKMLCETLRDAPHCDFAAASSRPVLSAVTFFESEFLAVVKEVPPTPEPLKESGSEKKNRKLEEERAKPAERAKLVAKEEIETLEVEEKISPKGAVEEVLTTAVTAPEAVVPILSPEPAAETGTLESEAEEVAAVDLPPASPAEMVASAGSEEIGLVEVEDVVEVGAAGEAVEEGSTVQEAVELAPTAQVGEAIVREEEEEPAAADAVETALESVEPMDTKGGGSEAALQQEAAPAYAPSEEPRSEAGAEGLPTTEETANRTEEVGETEPVEEPLSSPTEVLVSAGSEMTDLAEAEVSAELAEETASVEEAGELALEAEVEEEKTANVSTPETALESAEPIETNGEGTEAGLELEVAPLLASPVEPQLENVAGAEVISKPEESEAQGETKESKAQKARASKSKAAKAKGEKEKASGKKKKKGSSGGKK